MRLRGLGVAATGAFCLARLVHMTKDFAIARSNTGPHVSSLRRSIDRSGSWTAMAACDNENHLRSRCWSSGQRVRIWVTSMTYTSTLH